MRTFALLFQLAVGTGRVGAADSVSLLERLKDEQFWFMMRWRYQVESDRMPPRPPPPSSPASQGALIIATMKQPGAPASARIPKGLDLKRPIPGERGCDWEENTRFDIDQHHIMAHLIKNPPRLPMSTCPMLARGDYVFQAPGWIDAALGPQRRDSSRALRATMLRRLDSAAAKLPADRWITGQRVRLALDQADVGRARRAAAECRADGWWCLALQAYANYMADTPVGDLVTRAHAAMPLDARCEWDDIGPLLMFSGREAYEALPCARRDSINRVAWWLADPLFAEKGNERHTVQMMRRMDIELRRAPEVDLFTDWRPDYQGSLLTEMFARYGAPMYTLGIRPFEISAWGYHPDPKRPLDGLEPEATPVGWKFSRLDSRSMFLGHGFGAAYVGPPTHTMPAWRAILDPLGTRDEDWDLAPPRDTLNYWDGSWWAPEFFMRKGGPIVPLEYQVAMFRRAQTPLLASAVRWDTAGFTFAPPERAILATITTNGPDAPLKGRQDTIALRASRGIANPIAAGPTLLSLELIHLNGEGSPGRARLGVTAPSALAGLRDGEVAVSDLALVRAAAGEGPPATFDAMLARMLGTTTLRRPTSLAAFWEVYGLGERDTVDYALRIVRVDDANAVERALSLVGVGNASADSVVVTWREPRAGDPSATLDHGISVRPRSVVLDVSGLSAGRYTLDVTMQRQGASTVSTQRRFVVLRN